MSNRLYNPKKKPRKKEDLKLTDKLEIAGVTIAVIALTGWSGHAAVNSFKPIESAPRYELYMESIQDYVDGEWPDDTPEQTTEPATEPVTKVTAESEPSTENTSEQETEINKAEQKEETERITEPETESESQEQTNSESETETVSEEESETLAETETSDEIEKNLSDKAMEAKETSSTAKQVVESVKSEANKTSKKKAKQLFSDAKSKQKKMTETESEPEPESELESEKKVSYIATGILNIRENPDKGSLKIGQCAKYSNLTVLEEPNDEHPKWYKIKKGDLTGYVTAEFVEAQPEE